MAEYIEREAVNALIKAECSPKVAAYLIDAVAAIPDADVRPVVLCRDCKHWDIDWVPNYAKENEHFCPIVTLTTLDDWFCADGEKREES